MGISIASVTAFLCLTVGLTQACNFPPSLWCSSEIIAKKCGVYWQCSEYLKPKAAEPVNFTLYFESLCPDCKDFMREQLHKTYMVLGPSVVNLSLVPYGNARERRDSSGRWEFECQHGKQECVGNLIESCAIILLKNISVYFPFISCMESKDVVSVETAASKCAEELKIDLDPIMSCANGNQGNQIEHQMAQLTNELQPPHTYVPWVTLNGVHNEKIQRKAESNLLELLCEAYKGESPSACKKLQKTKSKCLR